MADNSNQRQVELVREHWQRVDRRYAEYFSERGVEPDCCDCHKAHCCRQLALGTESEARLIRDAVRRWSPGKQAALRRRLQALPKVARDNFSGACPFLVDERCQVYAVRPLACRAFHSMNKSRCKRRIKDPDPVLFSELSDHNRALRQRLSESGGEADVVAIALWMKHHWHE